MIWILLKEVFVVLFWPSRSDLLTAGRKKTFDQLMVVMGWAIVAFFLWVSIPHSIEIILVYEHGEWALPKAVAMALALELIPAFSFMLGLHNQSLKSWQRYTVMGLSIPFIALVLHIQYSYYYGPKEIRIWALELAAVLPYGILAGTVAIAFLKAGFQEIASDLAEKIRQAEEVIEARWREIVNQKEQELEATRCQLEAYAMPSRGLIDAPDVAREATRGSRDDQDSPRDATRWDLEATRDPRDDQDSSPDTTRDPRDATRWDLEATRGSRDDQNSPRDTTRWGLEATRDDLDTHRMLSRDLINPPDGSPETTRGSRDDQNSPRDTTRWGLEATREPRDDQDNSRENHAMGLGLLREERDGLVQYIASLEEAHRKPPEPIAFPRDEVDNIFRRMNPRAGGLKQADAKALIEELWNRMTTGAGVE